MATFAENLQQATNEIHTYTVDYTNDLPAGGSVTAGTATHIPPGGGAGSAVGVTLSSPYVFATLPAQALTGIHYLDILATFSNADKSSVRIPITVVYPAQNARAGMASIVSELRGLAEVGPADYEVGGIHFWDDAQLQDILDLHRRDIVFEELRQYPTMSSAGGTLLYKDYRSSSRFLEASTGGSSILYLQDGAGSVVPFANYSPDYRRGQFQFAADQRGTVYYLTGRSFDINAAAADIWRRKASHYATAFDFSTDNHSVSRSQVYQHCLEMAQRYEGLGATSIQSVSLWRSDMDDVAGEED